MDLNPPRVVQMDTITDSMWPMWSVNVQHFIYITLTWKQKAYKEKPIVTSMAKYYWNDVEMPQTPLYLKEPIILKFMDGATPYWDLFQ